MSKLLLTFYGDDFTGSTDALEQLTLAGVRTALFVRPPTPRQLKQFPGVKAIGVAGKTRSLAPEAMECELRPVFKKLKALRPRHVHYKICSTFDSSPAIGSIGCVMEVAARIFPAPFIPVLVAAPSLGRYTVFGQHFARYGIGSTGAIHRLDRHPSISKHPVTPMSESDLRLHLAKQTQKSVALFDILKVELPARAARAALKQMVAEDPGAILFDAVSLDHLALIGALLEDYSSATKQPLFSVGSSGIETALAAVWHRTPPAAMIAPPVRQILVGSGSCSPVTSGQIDWATKHGFAEVPLNTSALVRQNTSMAEVERVAAVAAKLLNSGQSVIVHTTRRGSDKRIEVKFRGRTAEALGTALGEVLRRAAEHSPGQRLCIAGGDTSSYAACALGIEALEMIAPLTPGAPLCRAHAPRSPVHKLGIVFKGGQVGGEDYFARILKGKP